MKGSNFRLIRFSRARKRAAFTLVEVSIALGIVGFALVGIMGALPLAMNSGRQSIEQSRAASLASTLFANFRTQPFAEVSYLDKPDGNTSRLNLKTLTGSDSVKFYATIVDLKFDPASTSRKVEIPTDPRRLFFQETRPSNNGYQIMLRFTNQPDGMLKAGMANRVEITISSLGNPKDAYRFTSVIANRQG